MRLSFVLVQGLSRWLVLAGMVTAVWASPAGAQLAYVSNENTGNVTVIDTSKGAVATTVPTAPGISTVAMSPDGAYAWVTNPQLNNVSVISTLKNQVVAQVAVGSSPIGVAITPDGNNAFVANFASGNVSVVTTQSALTCGVPGAGCNPTIYTVPLPTGTHFPLAVAITPDGTQAVVSDAGNAGLVYTINTADAVTNPLIAVVGSTSVGVGGASPLWLAITPDGTQTWMSAQAGPSSTTGVDVQESSGLNSFINVSEGQPVGVAITPDGTQAWVVVEPSGGGDGFVRVFPTSRELARPVNPGIPVGNTPVQLAFTPDGTQVYVTNSGDGTVSVINTINDLAVSLPVDAPGSLPTGIAIQPSVTAQPSPGIAPVAGTPISFKVTGPSASVVSSTVWDVFSDRSVLQTTSGLTNNYAYLAAGTYFQTVTVRDAAGATLLTKKIPVHVQSPVQAVRTTAVLVELLRTLSPTQKNNLLSPLGSAYTDLLGGNRSGAMNAMNLFINQLKVLVPSVLSAKAVAPVGGQAEAILISLGSPPPALGTGTLTPTGGNSAVGQPVTFTATWTVPDGKSWRSLQHVDLRLVSNEGAGADQGNPPAVALWARFDAGSNPGTFELLDENENVLGTGEAGSARVLETNTVQLDLAHSGFQGTGPTGPSVTVNFAVRFKATAAGEDSARVYQSQLLASDVLQGVQGPDQSGEWTVRPVQP